MSALQKAYFRLPTPLQHLLISTYGLKLRQARYGGRFARYLQELTDSEAWDHTRLEELRLRRLNQQIKRAAQVGIYRGLGLRAERLESVEQLSALPTVCKADLQRTRDELVTPEYRGSNSLVEIHTGGTTGRPLTVYCTRDVLRRNYAFFERFKRWAGLSSRSRMAVFAGRLIVPPEQASPPYWRHNWPNRALLLSSYHLSQDTIADYVEALVRFAPDAIDSYPSSIEPIAQYLSERGDERLRLRSVITSSETITETTRTRIEAAFGCRVFDHYGAAEMAALITQCEHGTYHVTPEFGVVEIVRPDGSLAQSGEEGEIVATGFINHVMPLIRYRTGDVAIRGDDACPCGRHFPTVERIIGRLDDVVVTPEGRRVGRLDPIFKAAEGIVETQIVQDRIDHVRVEIVPGPSFEPTSQERLVEELSFRLGPSMQIDVVHVASIPRAGSGKLRTVLNLLDQQAE